MSVLSTTHGGDLEAISQIYPNAPEPWLDLSTGISPWSYDFEEIGISHAFAQLPQARDYRTLKNAIASYLDCSVETVVATPGSEIVFALLPVLLKPKSIGMASLTYGDYQRVWQSTDCQIITAPNPLALADRVDVLMVCNPNNPDGSILFAQDLMRAYSTLRKRNGYLIVDEAYADLVPEITLTALGEHPGLVVTRSFGKFFGLPGLRLGWVIANVEFRQALEQRLGFWAINSLALKVAAKAYADTAWCEKHRNRLHIARTNLSKAITDLGIRIVGSTDLYILIDHPKVDQLAHSCAAQGVYLRAFTDHPTLLRVGIPHSMSAQNRFLACLRPFT